MPRRPRLSSAAHDLRGSALHLHDLLHRHHVVVQVAMIHSDPAMTSEHDQHAEGQRQDVVDVVGAGRDVEEEDEVDAHLGDREHRQRDGMLGSQTSVVLRDEEGDDGSSVASPRPIR